MSVEDSEPAEPNVVLRGGPFDGRRLRVESPVPVSLSLEGERFVYRPTSEIDTEFSTLTMWVFDRIEPV